MIDDLDTKIFKIDSPEEQENNPSNPKQAKQDDDVTHSIKDLILKEDLLPLEGAKPVVLIDTRNTLNNTQFYQVDRRMISFENKQCGILLLRNITSLK